MGNYIKGVLFDGKEQLKIYWINLNFHLLR